VQKLLQLLGIRGADQRGKLPVRSLMFSTPTMRDEAFEHSVTVPLYGTGAQTEATVC
jgi:hypothetical protein